MYTKTDTYLNGINGVLCGRVGALNDFCDFSCFYVINFKTVFSSSLSYQFWNKNISLLQFKISTVLLHVLEGSRRLKFARTEHIHVLWLNWNFNKIEIAIFASKIHKVNSLAVLNPMWYWVTWKKISLYYET